MYQPTDADGRVYSTSSPALYANFNPAPVAPGHPSAYAAPFTDFTFDSQFFEPAPVPVQYPQPPPAPHPLPIESPQRLTVKIPPPTMPAPILRRSGRHSGGNEQSSPPSGSIYGDSNASMTVDDQSPSAPPEPKVEYGRSSRGRKVAKKSYMESEPDDDDDELPDVHAHNPKGRGTSTQANGNTNGRQTRSQVRRNSFIASEEEDEDAADQEAYGQRRLRPRVSRKPTTIHSEDEAPRPPGRYATRSRGGPASGKVPKPEPDLDVEDSSPIKPRRLTRGKQRRKTKNDDDDDGYVDASSSGSGEISFDEANHSPPESDLPDQEDLDADADGDVDGEGETEETAGYALRERKRINYAIPPPLEELKAPPKPKGGRKGPRPPPRSLGWSATGAQLSRWMGDDSDSDAAPPNNGVLGTAAFAGGAGGLMPAGDFTAAGSGGGPSNMGKVGDSALADADPLGVNTNVTFDEVGGLDDHINSLKEMTLLPLLYPEVFQRFNVTPPRGVLFHGPPGTGKTLLARALAASCRSNGKNISFFMRKGADCLSKWVGEAERQLRLLFEEAKNCQPSIIFFDEIDGLAPVRSSKQDQVHASIVSTLLALMDGMDGRGQVIVIGATNRPDAIDPALRRPGRFDREFYFPLPNLAARERILRIMTRKWQGWETEKGEENATGLARMTKGYGGADLRALCTEAALNAVQRRYPQIYKSQDRLLLKPDTINVELRDFMIAIKKLVPSSARSTSSTASPLPTQLIPLLAGHLQKARSIVERVMPVGKKRTALEEAEWEDADEGNGLERELMLQSMETLRVYRPRVVIHGPSGMGQGYVAAAILHSLETYHVQSLELGNLMSDSTRTVEAAIVQLFMEAKRNQPSVIYIPSLVGWCAAVSETSRSTVRAMLDTLAPTDPVLLLAVVDGPFASLPRDVRAWFGATRENRLALGSPDPPLRASFFEELLKDIRRPPNEFPDGIQRRKRVLEELPIAPPLEPRQPTEAELAAQEENDQRVIALVKFRLGPILAELKRKFKRFTKRASEEYGIDPNIEVDPTNASEANAPAEVEPAVPEQQTAIIGNGASTVEVAAGSEQVQVQVKPQPRVFDMDLEKMHLELYRGKYLTPTDFMDDIQKIVHNATVHMRDDPERLYKAHAMLNATEVSMLDFDNQLRLECERMATRERKRRAERKEARAKAKARAVNGQGTGEPYAPGTRRSTRHNGSLDIQFTDPAALERKLKRGRSNELAADSPMSTEDTEGRLVKRSRIASEDPDRDPLQLVGASPSPAPTTDSSGLTVQHMSPRHLSPGRQHIHDVHMPSPLVQVSLAPPEHTDDTLPTLNGVDSFSGPPSAAPSVQASTPPPESALATATNTAIPSSEAPSTPAPDPHAMNVEREPSPLPEFTVDESQLDQLRTALVDQTSSLNIEELEQLRASCLACVWRHRSEWDRGTLLTEIQDIVREFVEEALIEDRMNSP